MKWTIIPTLLIFFCPQALQAAPWWDSAGNNEWYEEPEPWKEATVTIPDYPDADDLLEFHVDNPATRNHTYLLDPKSLSIGEDYVIRYSVVVKTNSGASNVFYDGMRCITVEYKNYAFGVGGTFIENQSAEWKKIKGGDFYRKALLRGILCDQLTDAPIPVEQIINQLKYP